MSLYCVRVWYMCCKWTANPDCCFILSGKSINGSKERRIKKAAVLQGSVHTHVRNGQGASGSTSDTRRPCRARRTPPPRRAWTTRSRRQSRSGVAPHLPRGRPPVADLSIECLDQNWKKVIWKLPVDAWAETVMENRPPISMNLYSLLKAKKVHPTIKSKCQLTLGISYNCVRLVEALQIFLNPPPNFYLEQ